MAAKASVFPPLPAHRSMISGLVAACGPSSCRHAHAISWEPSSCNSKSPECQPPSSRNDTPRGRLASSVTPYGDVLVGEAFTLRSRREARKASRVVLRLFTMPECRRAPLAGCHGDHLGRLGAVLGLPLADQPLGKAAAYPQRLPCKQLICAHLSLRIDNRLGKGPSRLILCTPAVEEGRLAISAFGATAAAQVCRHESVPIDEQQSTDQEVPPLCCEALIRLALSWPLETIKDTDIGCRQAIPLSR
mmetsp:Transcript_45087/g.127260  ORF Transcript_45087/g.127260 Transcript_45087/m.127260 type:complete len:247 (-) Transcript_45087:491-1231(-)